VKLEALLLTLGAGGALAWLALRSSAAKADTTMLPADKAPKPLDPAERDRRYGPLLGRVAPAPTPTNPEALTLPAGWRQENIVTVDVPDLASVPGANKGRITLHRRVVEPFRRLIAAWKEAGLLGDIVSWEGTFNPRFIRGSTTAVSTHAYATSFDLNARGNGLNETPLSLGQRGSVLRLVPVAEKLGWAWGGRFKRLDGMHFEYVGEPE
jgi:hypothetical protein